MHLPLQYFTFSVPYTLHDLSFHSQLFLFSSYAIHSLIRLLVRESPFQTLFPPFHHTFLSSFNHFYTHSSARSFTVLTEGLFPTTSFVDLSNSRLLHFIHGWQRNINPLTSLLTCSKCLCEIDLVISKQNLNIQMVGLHVYSCTTYIPVTLASEL